MASDLQYHPAFGGAIRAAASETKAIAIRAIFACHHRGTARNIRQDMKADKRGTASYSLRQSFAQRYEARARKLEAPIIWLSMLAQCHHA